MKTSQRGIDLITSFEGYRDKAYLCPAGVWTIGYGTTRYPGGNPVRKGESCTREQASEWKAHDLIRFEANVMRFNAIYNHNQNEFDALVSFAYNIGSINQLTQNGKRPKAIVADSILLYNRAGGVVMSGLVRRREAERVLYLLTPADLASQGNNNPFQKPKSTIRQGSNRQSVKWLQWQLNNLGYPLVVDGVWGPRTNAAVLAFQQQHGLLVDGLVGPKTKAELIS